MSVSLPRAKQGVFGQRASRQVLRCRRLGACGLLVRLGIALRVVGAARPFGPSSPNLWFLYNMLYWPRGVLCGRDRRPPPRGRCSCVAGANVARRRCAGLSCHVYARPLNLHAGMDTKTSTVGTPGFVPIGIPAPAPTPLVVPGAVALPCWQDTAKQNSVWHVHNSPACVRARSKPKKILTADHVPFLKDPGMQWCIRCNLGPVPTPTAVASASRRDASDSILSYRGLDAEDRGRVGRHFAAVADLDVAANTFTVTSWNIHGGSKPETMAAVAELARGFDVLCLQEVGDRALCELSRLADGHGWSLFHTGDSKTKNAILTTSAVTAKRYDWAVSLGDERGHVLGPVIEAAYPVCTVLACKGAFSAFFSSFHTEGSGTPATIDAAGYELEAMIRCLNLVTARALAGNGYVHAFAGDLNYHQLRPERQARAERTEFFHPPSGPTTETVPADAPAKLPADAWLVGPQYLVDVPSLCTSRNRYGSDHHFVYGYLAPKRAVFWRQDGSPSRIRETPVVGKAGVCHPSSALASASTPQRSALDTFGPLAFPDALFTPMKAVPCDEGGDSDS